MNDWDIYGERIYSHGETKRKAALIREQRLLSRKIKDSLSYHEVLIDGKPRQVSIINSDNLNEKTIISMPGENLICGKLVRFEDEYWLIIEKDANNEVYTKAKMIQCNHLLKWIDSDDIIHEQWCVIEDGTKYLTGEYEDRNFVVTRGDSRIAMTIGRNEDTIKFTREMRFIIDDPFSERKLAYLLTKPLKVGKTYKNQGVYSFVLQEVVSTADDNLRLGIADYFKHFPKDITFQEEDDNGDNSGAENSEGERKVWL